MTTKENGREKLKHLNLSKNSLGIRGFMAMNEEVLKVNGNIIETLNIGYNGITEVRFPMGIEPSNEKVYGAINLILDGNVFKIRRGTVWYELFLLM